jgi:hypothetical protein
MTTANLETGSLHIDCIDPLKCHRLGSATSAYEVHLRQTEELMLQLREYHMISQEYVLSIPYLCQIYHLLNLKHLETVHGFSLKGLKVSSVSQFEETTIGGSIKFQTILASSLNALKLWREPIVEAELILHTPYTIELNLPVYNNSRIAIIFNVLPLSDRKHKLFIDIYSDLAIPKLVLQTILHCASCLTLFEDLPYLHRLANSNLHRLVKSGKVSNHKTMQLFKRFVDLYGSGLEQYQSAEVIGL